MTHANLLSYLRDHLAGARGALELIEYLRDHAGDTTIRTLMGPLLHEIQTDRDVLEQIAEQLGGGSSTFKDVSAWLAEKLSRLKIGAVGDSSAGLPLFEAVEALALGILGKVALWDTLLRLSSHDPSIPQLDYAQLRERAKEQHARVEEQRLRLGEVALASPRL